jgi:hypothetical protein
VYPPYALHPRGSLVLVETISAASKLRVNNATDSYTAHFHCTCLASAPEHTSRMAEVL